MEYCTSCNLYTADCQYRPSTLEPYCQYCGHNIRKMQKKIQALADAKRNAETEPKSKSR